MSITSFRRFLPDHGFDKPSLSLLPIVLPAVAAALVLGLAQATVNMLSELRSTNTIPGLVHVDNALIGWVDKPTLFTVSAVLRSPTQTVWIEIGADVLGRFDLGRIDPLPNIMRTERGAIRLVFDKPDTEDVAKMAIELTPRASGNQPASLRIGIGQTIVAETTANQWVIP